MPCMSIEQIAQAIEVHLRVNPHAKDTAEGIHLWWIDWQGAPESVTLTQAALELLETQGIMVCVVAGRRELWSAAPRT